MTTRRAACEKIIKRGLQWLVDEKIVAKDHIQTTMQEYKITVDKIVAYVERFFIPPYEANLLDKYVRDELGRIRTLLQSSKAFGASDHTANIATAYAKKPLTDSHVRGTVQILSNLIKVIQLQPVSKKQKQP